MGVFSLQTDWQSTSAVTVSWCILRTLPFHFDWPLPTRLVARGGGEGVLTLWHCFKGCPRFLALAAASSILGRGGQQPQLQRRRPPQGCQQVSKRPLWMLWNTATCKQHENVSCIVHERKDHSPVDKRIYKKIPTEHNNRCIVESLRYFTLLSNISSWQAFGALGSQSACIMVRLLFSCTFFFGGALSKPSWQLKRRTKCNVAWNEE